jgi:hypothetical protein
VIDDKLSRVLNERALDQAKELTILNSTKEKKTKAKPKFPRKLYNQLFPDENDKNDDTGNFSSDSEGDDSLFESEIDLKLLKDKLTNTVSMPTLKTRNMSKTSETGSKDNDRGVLQNASNTSTKSISARSKSESSASEARKAGSKTALIWNQQNQRVSSESNDSIVLTTSRAVDTVKMHHNTNTRKENTNTTMNFDDMVLAGKKK